MNPTPTLPETYSLAWEVDMKKDLRLNIILQVVGTILLFGFGWGFWEMLQWLRPGFSLDPFLLSQPLLAALLALLAIFLWITAHELIHGAFFWLFSQDKPQFGYGLGYFYAAMPGWFFPKWPYLAVGLAPLVLLSLLGMLLMPFLPAYWAGFVFLGTIINAGGAVGDLYVCFRIALEAQDVYIRDRGDGFEVFRRNPRPQ
jgi:hypothetical protein